MKLKKLLKHNVNNIVEVRIRKGEEVVYRDSPKKLNENFLNCKIITFCIEQGEHGYENYLIVSIK